jgi:hypothetical protein
MLVRNTAGPSAFLAGHLPFRDSAGGPSLFAPAGALRGPVVIVGCSPCQVARSAPGSVLPDYRVFRCHRMARTALRRIARSSTCPQDTTPPPHSAAFPAAMVLAIAHSVLARERMAVLAMRFHALLPTLIFAWGDRFQMKRIDAERHSTKVIDLHAVRDRADPLDVRGPMNILAGVPFEPRTRVPVGCLGALPNPARRIVAAILSHHAGLNIALNLSPLDAHDYGARPRMNGTAPGGLT